MAIENRKSKIENPHAIVLAAGRGTRMGGDPENSLPKVVHEVAGEAMVRWVVRACRAVGVQRVIVVVGYKGELVREALVDFEGVDFVEQTEQLGTAHAVRMAAPLFEGKPACDVFVLAGDGPLIRRQTLARLLEVHRRGRAAMSLATAVLDDPTGYGRVLRDNEGGLERIVEQKDATPEQLAVREVNPSYYCFDSAALFTALGQVRAENRQREFYLTDVPAILKARGETVSVIGAVPPEDVLSINTPEQLAHVDALLRRRLESELTASTERRR